MGRLESLTAWALGRTPYEDEVIRSADGNIGTCTQQYNEHGHPRNPETKRRERESVRAANEVMQVTGVVEDALAARVKVVQYKEMKIDDTFRGLRLMEVGRGLLIGGVWGVLGLRRRVLIYKPYAELGLFTILRNESRIKSAPGIVFSGIPTVLAYHISDYVGFILQACMDGFFDEDEVEYTPRQLWFKHTTQTLIDIVFCYVTLHYRMFAILQQLNLIPASQLLPSLRSFLPYSEHSPLRSSSILTSSTAWVSTLLLSARPMLLILLHGRVKFYISKLLYRPIYKTLPRPIGDSMFTGLDISPPDMEYDTPDRNPPTRQREDARTLRALEGRPALEIREEREEERMRLLSISMEQHEETTDDEDEDGEMHQATLISFDVEATDAMPDTAGSWSAELRSANETKPSNDTNYRVTGLTMLPTILAAEGFREIVAGILVMPLEAIMVRVIGREYRKSAGLGVSDIYELFSFRDVTPASTNLLGVFAIQVAITGIVWAGFTVGALWWSAGRGLKFDDKEDPPTS